MFILYAYYNQNIYILNQLPIDNHDDWGINHGGIAMSDDEDLLEEPVNDEEFEIKRSDRTIEGYSDDDLGMDYEE